MRPSVMRSTRRLCDLHRARRAETASRAKAAVGAADAAVGAAVARAAKAARVRISSPATSKAITSRSANSPPIIGDGAQQPGDQPADARSEGGEPSPRACRRKNARAKASASAKARMSGGDATATDEHGAVAGRRGGRRNRRDREGYEGGAASCGSRQGPATRRSPTLAVSQVISHLARKSTRARTTANVRTGRRRARRRHPSRSEPAYAQPQYEAAPQSMATSPAPQPEPEPAAPPRRRSTVREPAPTFGVERICGDADARANAGPVACSRGGGCACR